MNRTLLVVGIFFLINGTGCQDVLTGSVCLDDSQCGGDGRICAEGLCVQNPREEDRPNREQNDSLPPTERETDAALPYDAADVALGDMLSDPDAQLVQDASPVGEMGMATDAQTIPETKECEMLGIEMVSITPEDPDLSPFYISRYEMMNEEGMAYANATPEQLQATAQSICESCDLPTEQEWLTALISGTTLETITTELNDGEYCNESDLQGCHLNYPIAPGQTVCNGWNDLCGMIGNLAETIYCDAGEDNVYCVAGGNGNFSPDIYALQGYTFDFPAQTNPLIGMRLVCRPNALP